jgi:hypothetical protein
LNQAQEKLKFWIISHIKNQDKLTTTDHRVIEFLIVGLPNFVGMLLVFGILSAVYLWGYKKYGFERTLIVLLINIIISIGQVAGAIKSLAE